MTSRTIDRRGLLAGLAALAVVARLPAAAAEALPPVTVSRDPACGCCEAWVEHMRAAGFRVTVVETTAINRVKARLGVPQDLASCHTAEVAGYVLEGHVPADAVVRLLAERPVGTGLAVPGMPVGSPGMEVEGVAPDTYEVLLFGPAGQRAFARYEGGRLLKG
ncbi:MULTISPECIES: DUF411 domain-containing protein [Chelatococcus]|uniref:Metal-binding protein n=3 Tax=Chelatococcus TaxID=28209 RepID=A0A840BU19_9HYPH|nr:MULTISPECIES: DUF411 domain-containing protein [Chelatococcus]ALA18088.1 metal-binding protein [Chelatococcus sp. CO-6]APF36804.1 metal-binding protein [Chelatococcus daeguensis]MBB4015172.1 hypothetical protein [Chelatococcus caeni]CUA88381.1 Uncharacterized conserved protein [Chelatococcus sambhunathii]